MPRTRYIRKEFFNLFSKLHICFIPISIQLVYLITCYFVISNGNESFLVEFLVVISAHSTYHPIACCLLNLLNVIIKLLYCNHSLTKTTRASRGQSFCTSHYSCISLYIALHEACPNHALHYYLFTGAKVINNIHNCKIIGKNFR